MIDKAVFSYLNNSDSFNQKGGFRRFEDLLYTFALATLQASRHFGRVQVVSTEWGTALFKALILPVTEYSTALEPYKTISPSFWAFGKLIAYTLQKEPFVHLDNDVFIWKPLPERILMADLCFQSKEQFEIPGYGWYVRLKSCWEDAPVRPQAVVDNEVNDFAYNCGICGGHLLDFFHEWRQCSEQYIFAPENQPLFFDRYRILLHHQNLFHEQYFATALIRARGIVHRVEVIADDVTNIQLATNDGYTHLWGATKRDAQLMERVRKRLRQEDPSLYQRVHDFCKDMINNKVVTYAAEKR